MDLTDHSDRDGVADRSRGWEAIAPEFVREASRSTVGVSMVQAWAHRLPRRAVVLDLGCGPGTPRSQVLADNAFDVYALDASPTLAAAYQRRFPHAHVRCEPAEHSSLFDRTFDGILVWVLLFLLPPDVQRSLFPRIAGALKPGGRLLFTAPAPACTWTDLSTGQPSVSLGAEAYHALLARSGLRPVGEHDDEGENHYFEALRDA